MREVLLKKQKRVECWLVGKQGLERVETATCRIISPPLPIHLSALASIFPPLPIRQGISRLPYLTDSFDICICQYYKYQSYKYEINTAGKSARVEYLYVDTSRHSENHSRKKAGSRDPGSRTFFGPN